MDNGELLRQLKIDRSLRESVQAAPVRWPWIAGATVLVVRSMK